MCRQLIFIISFVLLLGLTLASTADAELVGWWKLDDGSGTTAIDSSGNGNDGALIGDPQWVDGWIGGALEFDGDDYVDTGYTEDLVNWTITTWVISPLAPTSGDPSGPVHREQNYQINWNHTSSDWQGAAGVNVGGWYNASFQTLEANRWYHLAATYDGEELKAYKDGDLTATNTLPSGPPSLEANSLKLARHAMNVQYFTGTVDDVKIYNHVLSEFDLHAIAAPNFQQAWKPRPEDGEVDVLLDTKLIWNQGIVSAETFELYNEHQIYIGTDFNDVNSVTVPTATVTNANEYAPSLDYDTTYNWRIDEVNSLDPNSSVKGEVWSFTSANFIVAEDFEDYNDFSPNEIWNTWIDGFGDPTNGSTAGYPAPAFFAGEHYLEDEIVHGGNWSLPVFYDNSSAGLSEVTRTLNADWTQDDVVTLTLFYYGDASNVAEPMYVALNGDAVVTNDDPKAALDNEWNQWDILLQDFADMGVNLANVNTMSIGFGNKANPQPGGGTGHVFFDDIRLYRSLPKEVEPEPEPVDPGTDNLVAYYAFENNAQDGSGNGYNATTSGNPQYVSGLTDYGMALELDGTGDYVSMPIGSLIESLTNSTFAIWVNWSGVGGAWQRILDIGTGETVNMFLTSNTGGNLMRFAITISGNADEDQTTSPEALPSGWHHVAVKIDPDNSTHSLYLDGNVIAQNTAARYTPSDLGVTTQNWLGRAQYVADPYFRGSLDEFRIYNRALSEAEIRYLAGK